MKKRINKIINKKRPLAALAAAAFILTLALVACTYTGAGKSGSTPEDTSGTTATETAAATDYVTETRKGEGADVTVTLTQSNYWYQTYYGQIKTDGERVFFNGAYDKIGEFYYSFGTGRPAATMAVRGDTMVFCPYASGRIFVSADGAKNWTEFELTDSGYIFGIFPYIFSDNGISVVFYNQIGDSLAFISNNGGKSFEKTPADIPDFFDKEYMNSAAFYDKNTAVLTYRYYGTADPPNIIVTLDGGKTWKRLNMRVPKKAIASWYEAADGGVYAEAVGSVALDGSLYVRVNIHCGMFDDGIADVLYLKSVNGGKTWTWIDNFD